MTQRTGQYKGAKYTLDGASFSSDLVTVAPTAARTQTFPDVSGTILNTGCAQVTATSAAPTGTTSATSVMMGIAASITPTASTRLCITVSGQMANNTINDGVTVDLRYGTGSAPTNGAAVTGTLVGIAQTNTVKTAAQVSGFAITGVATGLTVGTAYWIDVSVKAVTGGTATVTGVTICAIEV